MKASKLQVLRYSSFITSFTMWNGEDAGCSSSSKDDKNKSRKREHEEGSCTLEEIIGMENHLNSAARALLGSADDSVCTYPEGYPPRQMIYSCKTCSDNGSNPMAICYGCISQCHADHDVLELYTKRKVCCDCGNSKFTNKCKLFPEKQALNERNSYNHNYAGLFCVCKRHYPADETDTVDEDGQEDGEMIQCIICEDWFHANHLLLDGNELDCEELVCGGCAEKEDFLKYYADDDIQSADPTDGCILKQLMNKYSLKHSDDAAKTDSNTTTMLTTNETVNQGGTENETPENNQDTGLKQEEEELKNEHIDKNGTEKVEKEKDTAITESADIKEGSETAEKEENGKNNEDHEKIGNKFEKLKTLHFKLTSWRERLCKCDDCMRMYDDHNVNFLLDPEDSLSNYMESRAVATPSLEQEREEMVDELVSSLGRDGAIYCLQGYEELKSKLNELLSRKAAEDVTVTTEDINNLFTELRGDTRSKFHRME